MKRSILALCGVTLCTAAAARADEALPARAERLTPFGRSAASDDTGHAVVLNPANLAYLPSWEARATHLYCPDDVRKAGCGWAFDFSTPLIWDFATSVRFDYMQPPWGGPPGVGVGFPFRGYDYAWVTWGVGGQLGERTAIGASIQRSYSQNDYTNGLLGLTAGISYRPFSRFGFAVVANDFNGPGSQSLAPLSPPVLDRSFTFAMAFRPTGRRNVEMNVDLRYLQSVDQWIPRVSAGVDIPGVGRARGDIEVAHLPSSTQRGIIASAGLEVSYDKMSASGGAVFGSGLGSSTAIGAFGSLTVSGYRPPGVPLAQRAVYIRIEDTPGTRGHIKLLRKLWDIADDKEIASVTLIMRSEPASSFARAEEIADALRLLRARGKKSLCSWEDNGPVALYACANADRIVVNPAGGLRYAGLKSQHMYFAGLLSKIGVRAEFVRIGAHKTAPEQFTNETGSEVARADHEDILRNREAVFVRNVAVGRKMTDERVKNETIHGPFIAQEARDAGFVDEFAFDDEVERATQNLVGRDIRYEEYKDVEKPQEVFGSRGKIGILYVDGDIVDGRSQKIPILNMKLVGSYSIGEQIKHLRDDPTIRAVVLRIESPGGSSMASDVMWRELVLLANKKPLIVSMGTVAASGGYYIATASKNIFALPLTITGSIGIFYGKADVSELLKKIGVNIETYKTAPRADAESFYRPFTPEERVELRRKVGQFYDVFLDRVARGRGMSKEEVDAVGQGRVWTGQQALRHHLVDHMGGIRHALEAARSQGHLPFDAPIEEYPPPETSLLETALKIAGVGRVGLAPTIALPTQIADIVRAVAPMAIYNGDTPLARMEWVTEETMATGD